MENFSFNSHKEQKEKTPPVRDGVSFVFEQHPELANIGTPEQYSVYVDTIFPESQMGDIVYHGTASKEKIETFDFNRSNFGNAVFFTKDKKFAETYAYDEVRDGLVQAQVLDIKKPFDYNDPEKIQELCPIIKELISLSHKSPTGVNFMINPQGMQVGDNFIENPTLDDAINHYIHRLKNGAWRIIETPAIIKFLSEKYDSIKVVEHGRENIAVFNQNQIHVLGSQLDSEKFKEFVNKLKIESISPSVIEKISIIQDMGISVTHKEILELSFEIQQGNIELHRLYNKKLQQEADGLSDGDPRIKFQIGIILIDIILKKELGKDYSHDLDDAMDYAYGVQDMDIFNKIEKFK